MHKVTKIVFKMTMSWLILAGTSKAGILGLYTGTSTNITNTYPLIVTGPGLTSNRPNYYIIMDTNYAATTGVNFLSSVSTNDIVTNYLWTFQNGTPASSTNACPGPVIFPTIGYGTDDVCQVALQHMVGTNVCTSITSQITNVVGGVTNTNTVTNWLYTINVQVPTITFTNDQSNTYTNIPNYITNGALVVNSKVPITTSVYLGIGVPQQPVSNFICPQDPQAIFYPSNGVTDTNGLFTNSFTSTNDSAPPPTNVTIEFIGPSATNMPIVSPAHQMVPAVYQPLYRCTVYFTTKEDGFAHPGSNPTSIIVYNYNRNTIIATNIYPYNFAHSVKMEGYGRVSTPFNSPSGTTDYYLGYDTDLSEYFADTAARAGTTILHPTVGEDQSVIHSCAIDRTVSPRIPRNYYIETTDTNISVSSAMDTSEFVATDTGATDAVVGYHVDLYYGDDEPLTETDGVSKHCTFQGDGASQYIHQIILVGPNP